MNVVGVMWARNESDLLPYTLEKALKQVDTLLFIDNGSTDNTYDVAKSFKLEYCTRTADILSGMKCHPDAAGRQHLLEEVRRRFGYKDTWVQVIESDSVLLDTDVRQVIKKFSIDDTAVIWHMLNTADGKYAYWYELLTYTFRPFPKLEYEKKRLPWPKGFGAYTNGQKWHHQEPDSPLILHYGFRGRTPKFHSEKVQAYSQAGIDMPDLMFEASREGWTAWLNTVDVDLWTVNKKIRRARRKESSNGR